MSDNKVAVVIPVYKVHLASEEIISLKRCSEVLHKYHFIIVCSKALKTKAYVDILNRNQIAYSYAYFDEDCFETIASYNRLLLSVEFYETFKQYEYILIYQLDAYVFRDELEFWCNKGYDYIGAPLIGKHTE